MTTPQLIAAILLGAILLAGSAWNIIEHRRRSRLTDEERRKEDAEYNPDDWRW